MQRKPQKILFELPRPRGRSRCSPEAAKAGYWHRRATAIEKKLASVSREATEAKEAAAEATTKIAAMENTIALMQEMLQNASAEVTEAEEEVATAQDDELDELMLLQVRTAAEAKAWRNKEWQDKFFKWWHVLEPTGLRQKHKQDKLKPLIRRWHFGWRRSRRGRLLFRQEVAASLDHHCAYIDHMYEIGDLSREDAEALVRWALDRQVAAASLDQQCEEIDHMYETGEVQW
jgi:hypothetical protein